MPSAEVPVLVDRHEKRALSAVRTLPSGFDALEINPPSRDQIRLSKDNLRRDGPILFIEYFNTSYDPTPYLAVDQLAYTTQQTETSREVMRLQIVVGRDRSDLLLWKKAVHGGWNLEKAQAIVHDEFASALDADAYWKGRGDIRSAKIAHEYEIRRALNSRFEALGISDSQRKISVVWPDADAAPALSCEFGKILASNKPAIIGCTGDSKVFAPMRELLRSNHSLLENSLVVLGGIHANNAHDAIVRNEADGPQPLFDLIHTWPIGEKDFRKLILAFNRPDNQLRLTELARLENFTATVSETSHAEFGTSQRGGDSIWLSPNPELAWPTQGVEKCPSAEQMPTSWGDERPIVRRLKGAWGCQFSCSYCATAGNYRPGDIEQVEKFFDSVVDEIKIKKLDPSIVLVYFEDANFSGAFGKQVLQLSERYPFKLGIQIRYDCVKPLFTDLIKGNAAYLFLGMESFDDALRVSVNKQNKLSPAQMYEISQSLKAANIGYLVSCIVGLPGEDISAMARTIAFTRLQSPEKVSIELPKIYPNTPFAEDYLVETGLDPAKMYTLGEGSIRSPKTGMETIGSILHSALDESKAEQLMQLVDQMMLMDFSELWKLGSFRDSFVPLGSTRYTRAPDDLGFYRRVD